MKKRMRKSSAEYEKRRGRRKRVTVRMTENEYESLLQNSRKIKMTMNDYILQALRDSMIIVQDFENLSETVNALNRIGNNINQIAHHANVSGYAGRDEIKEIQEMIRESQKIVMDAVEANTGEALERRKEKIGALVRKADGKNGVH